jgi:hypothetical protein
MTSLSAPVRRLARAALLVLLGSTILAGPSSAAFGSPGPVYSPAIQAWLDADTITPDAPPGGVVEVGVTFWDTSVQALAEHVDGVFVRLHPAKGNAAPSEGRITADFPGHVLAALVVPKGGPGKVTLGIRGQSCDAGGACKPADFPVPFAGTGPPPDAKTFDLVTGSFHDIVGDVVVGRPTALTVEVMPRGLWDVTAVGLSDRVDVIARDPNDASGAQLGLAALERQGDVGTPYVGTIVVRQAGTVELSVAIPGGGADLEIAGERKVVTVIEAGRRPSTAPAAASEAARAPTPTPAAAEPGGGIPAIAWIAAGVLLVFGGGFLLLRFLADQ